jgi:rSAM/selenodomain-associated transferase 2
VEKFTLSIIIPILNEEENIGKLLGHLIENSSKENISEIIVIDGGSSDNSESIVKKFKQVTFLKSEKGRAKQMNTGAKNAKGNIFYFLHADSCPPKHFDQLIIDEVKIGNLAGCFKMKFDNNHWWLKLASWFTQFRWRACRGGDQSQFITKNLFKSLGGFDERFTVYEDNDLINKLYVLNQFVVIQQWITTSARRYETNGIWKLQYHFWMIYIKKWFGASADELFGYYKKYIN